MDSALLGLNKRCQDFWVTKHQDEEGSWAAEAAAFCFQSGSNYLNYLNYPNYPYVSPGTGSPARNWDHQNSAGVGRKPNRHSTAVGKVGREGFTGGNWGIIGVPTLRGTQQGWIHPKSGLPKGQEGPNFSPSTPSPATLSLILQTLSRAQKLFGTCLILMKSPMG